MVIIESASQLKEIIKNARSLGATFGFVPTMGALHAGHISLIKRAKADNDMVICSIFVNPTQFNDPDDLLNYPRTLLADYELLSKEMCDLAFVPTVREMYPDGALIGMDFGNLERVMEGAYRKGHFKAVATVVSRFFNIIRPDSAYFGEKDFQQLAVIKELNSRVGMGIKIIGCPTEREPDGLAMSSRNIHLTAEERKAAPVIYESLLFAAKAIKESDPRTVRKQVIEKIQAFPGFRVQYLEFVNSTTLLSIENWKPSEEHRVCIAVETPTTRLIDNVAI